MNPTQPVTGTPRSDTPRTNAEQKRLYEEGPAPGRTVRGEFADFARTLELELTAATQRADGAERLAGELAGTLEDLLMHGTTIKDNGRHGEYVHGADPEKAREVLACYAATKKGGAT